MNIFVLQNTISIINPPGAVVPGQSAVFQISYDLSLDWFGEWVRFRICSDGSEIGANNELLFGHAADITTVTATIPSGATGTITLKAEVTINELSNTCSDPNVIAYTSSIVIPIITQLPGTISLINLPNYVTQGQEVDFQISYNLNVSSYGEWVRFRICSNNTEIGTNLELLFGNAIGTLTATVTIPVGIVSITIHAEVTTNELSNTCGDPDVIASTSPITITVVEAINSVSLINVPSSVVAGETVVFQISYNLNVSSFGEWVRFRICYLENEIGSNNQLLFGRAIGYTTVTVTIPVNATGTVILRSEVTTDELSGTCGDPGVMASTAVEIPVTGGINVINMISPPTTALAGQLIDVTISYTLSVDLLGEWVRFRICHAGIEIGNNIDLLFGNVSGTTTVGATIPATVTGTISIKAEVTTDELSSTCGDSSTIASTAPVDITITGQANSLTITNIPTTVAAGQVIIFNINYNLPSVSLPEIVRFRMCSSGFEIGSNIESLILNRGGSTTVTATIPETVVDIVTIKAEVTINEFNDSCGDPDVIASTAPVDISVSGAILCTEPQLFINGKKGILYFDYAPVDLSLYMCGDANTSYIIDRTDTIPDTNIAVGNTDGNGIATAPYRAEINGRYTFQAGTECFGFICNKLSNEVIVQIGPECPIRNPITGECIPTGGLTTIALIGGGILASYLLFRAYLSKPRSPPK